MTDTGKAFVPGSQDADDAGKEIQQHFSGGAAHGADQVVHAGARLPLNTVDSYKSVKEDWNLAIVDLADDSTLIYDGPAIIGGIYIDTVMSAHACPIKNDTATMFTLLASSAVGPIFESMKGTRFDTSLVVDPDNAASGIVLIQWRKL